MNILVLSAHPDDLEMSCGGSVLKWTAMGHKVYSLVMVQDVPQKDYLELASSMYDTIQIPWPATRDFAINSEAVAQVEKSLSGVKFDRIVTHWKEDWHQDHRACYELGRILARKQPAELWHMSSHPYHLKYSEFNPNMYVDISYFAEKKYDILEEYPEEFVSVAWKEGVYHHDRWRGTFIDATWAEVFQIGNMIS